MAAMMLGLMLADGRELRFGEIKLALDHVGFLGV
jgi:hypothetical protein